MSACLKLQVIMNTLHKVAIQELQIYYYLKTKQALSQV